MVMIFTLVSAVQEKLTEIVEDIKSEKERAVREKEEELKRKEEVNHLFSFNVSIHTLCINKFL